MLHNKCIQICLAQISFQPIYLLAWQFLSSLNCRLVKKTLSGVLQPATFFCIDTLHYATSKASLQTTKRAFFGELFCPFFPYKPDERYAFNFALSGMIHLSKMPGLYRIQLENTCLVMGAISRISPVNATLFGLFVAPYPHYFPTHSVPFHCYTLSTVM